MEHVALSPTQLNPWEGNKVSVKGQRIELCHGRELLGLTFPQAAEMYGQSVEAWLDFEFNRAPLPSETLDRIETDLRQRWA